MATRRDPNSSTGGRTERPTGRTSPRGTGTRPAGGGRPGDGGSPRRARRIPPALRRRRLLTGIGLLLVLALLVWGIVSIATRSVESEDTAASGGGVATSEATQSGTQSGASSGGTDDRYSPSSIGSDGSVDGSSGETGPVTIPTCEPDDLGITLGVQGSSVSVGAGATFSVALEDTSDIQCSTAWGQLSVKVLSGDQTIYDSTSCADRDTTSTPLLLTPGASWSGTLSWSGDVYDGCTALDVNGDGKTDVAAAGTYRVQVLLNGQRLGDEQVFEVR